MATRFVFLAILVELLFGASLLSCSDRRQLESKNMIAGITTPANYKLLTRKANSAREADVLWFVEFASEDEASAWVDSLGLHLGNQLNSDPDRVFKMIERISRSHELTTPAPPIEGKIFFRWNTQNGWYVRCCHQNNLVWILFQKY